MALKVILILLICATVFAEIAKILGVFHRPSRSHHILGRTLFKALAKRGHQVTLLRPFRMNTPGENYEKLRLTSINSPRLRVPNMIQVNGLHIMKPGVLKDDLKELMDSASNGVICCSLESNVKISDLPKSKLKAIAETFAKLPTKILWKFDTDDVPNLFSNVKIGKWFPQSDILAHPNVRLFVTHGGLMSTMESIYHGVPMVGIPFFGDQENNVDDSVNKGCAVKVHFQDLSEETLTKAINEVLNNPKYRENVKRRSLLLKDQPLKPLDNAVFWVEYVLRHKGTRHLKTSALKLRWYQYYLLEVSGFLLGDLSDHICNPLSYFVHGI